jgi:hypothetical protein
MSGNTRATGRGRRCWSGQTTRSAVGTRPVTNARRDGLEMRRTATALRLGTLASRSQQLCVWHPKADSPERCSMWAAGPARTLFTSPRWDCRFWALTWLKQPWRLPDRKLPIVGSRLSSLRLTPLQLERLGRTFETVLDSGLFHTFDGDERIQYVASLASVTEHGGTLYVLCFSDGGPNTGPHPVSQKELRAAFNPRNGWDIAAIEPDRLQTRFHDNHGAPAWCAKIKRALASSAGLSGTPQNKAVSRIC